MHSLTITEVTEVICENFQEIAKIGNITPLMQLDTSKNRQSSCIAN